jgi:hypothetical protein
VGWTEGEKVGGEICTTCMTFCTKDGDVMFGEGI